MCRKRGDNDGLDNTHTYTRTHTTQKKRYDADEEKARQKQSRKEQRGEERVHSSGGTGDTADEATAEGRSEEGEGGTRRGVEATVLALKPVTVPALLERRALSEG